MKHKGKWASLVAWLYYTTGLAYYVYHWGFVLAGISVINALLSMHYHFSPVVPGIFTAVGICSFVISVGFWRKTVSTQLAGKNPWFKLKLVEVDYNVLDEKNCDYMRIVEAKVIYPTDHYIHKFFWSGEGSAQAEAVTGIETIKVYEDKLGANKICRVEFGRILQKGEVCRFSYRLRLRGAQKTLKNFLGFSADTPVDHLKLTVRFATEPRLKKYQRQILHSDQSEMPLNTEEVTIEEPWVSKTLEWETKLKLPHAYFRIIWSEVDPMHWTGDRVN